MSALDHDDLGGVLDADLNPVVTTTTEVCKPNRKNNKRPGALKKHPQAPKRFKSSYISFFMAKQAEIKAELGDEANVTTISKRSAEMWKNLDPADRAHWTQVADEDKARYQAEKASYTGPWQTPCKRTKKDPSAPRRPMSAFLFFSMGKRQQIKLDNPDMKNTDVSRVLGEMWRGLTPEEKLPFQEREKTEREKYKVAIAEWRKNDEAKQEAHRKQQSEAAALNDVGAFDFGGPAMNVHHHQPSLSGSGYMPMAFPTPTGAYNFPMNGKTPVVLGPNGMPHYQVVPPPPQPIMAPPSPRSNAPIGYDDGTGVLQGQPVPFDYSGEHDQGSH